MQTAAPHRRTLGMTYSAGGGEANGSLTGDANPRAQQANIDTWLVWQALDCYLDSKKTTVLGSEVGEE